MLNLSFAGPVGRDAEYKEGHNGNGRCQFSVATSVGYGENKQTIWIDVTIFGKGAMGLSKLLTKGKKVAGSGPMTTREHNGKTYIQCQASGVTILGDGQKQERVPGSRNTPIDIDSEVPF